MKYSIIISLMLLSGTAFASEFDTGSHFQGLANLRIIMGKISETLKANKDLETLQSLGMPESEVLRLRQALQMKVKQLTEDSVYVIRSI